MVGYDRIETNVLQLFAHTENLKWFSAIYLLLLLK